MAEEEDEKEYTLATLRAVWDAAFREGKRDSDEYWERMFFARR